jgi:hypothetical protein
MTLLSKIQKSKYHLLFTVLPLIIVAAGLKILVHYAGWEIIPKELTSFFPSILTGIIFILGFLLAGVVSDYKESEKIPNEMAASLYILWREAKSVFQNFKSQDAANLMDKIKMFVPMLRLNFFIKGDREIYKLLDAIYEDIIPFEKHIAPPAVVRLKNEQANLRKLLSRMEVIKKTDFIPSVFVSLKAISIIFLAVYCLLTVETWWVGVLLISIFTFVIFSIIFLISNMEDPFEYDASGENRSDEISLAILDQLKEDIEKTI